MASTRQIDIYEDPPFNAPPYESLEDVRPLLDPSIPASDGRSPLKLGQAKATSPKAAFSNLKHLSLPPPHGPTFTTDSPVKQPQAAFCYSMAPTMIDTAVFGSPPALPSFEQENHEHLPHSDNYAQFPDLADGYKSPKAKRVITSSEHSKARKSKPAEPQVSTQPQLPEPYELPPLEDTGKKPPFSYAQLIGMAILRAPDRRLTLAQIYKWISDTFAFYRLSTTPTGWQNSIRHNLSISEAFTKQERRKDDPGKGNYWIIVPGKEAKFLKQKTSRRSQSAGGPTMKTFSQPLNEPSSNVWSMPVDVEQKSVVKASHIPQQPSSDATIPASDAAPEDPQQEDANNMPPPPSRYPLSSPSPEIGSSPPVTTAIDLREESPLLASDPLLPVTETRGKKRNATAMDDSGYFSSLESSIARRLSTAKGSADLEANQPRLKRGRAEEEIARIRSSSHDISPSKNWSLAKQPTPQLVSSSPFRELENSVMLAPLTPSLTFKLPAKPPASVSPGTNLRNHRNQIKALVGSPMRDMGTLYSDVTFSPMFNLIDDDNGVFNEGLHSTFDIFDDTKKTPYSHRVSPSPEKRSACRNRLARPSTTSSALADVTGTRLNRRVFAPTSKAPYLDSPIRPQKSVTKLRFNEDTYDNPNHDNAENEAFFNLNFLADQDDEQDDFGGLDILQGFQKIGRNQNPTPKVKKATRPALGARSHTSRF
ncbi:MAG: hypothetical protein Q9225_000275 [Loekoesia sp. 1 TL-2023]